MVLFLLYRILLRQPAFIGTGIRSGARAITHILTPIQQPVQLTVGTSKADDKLYNGLAVALYRPLEAPGTGLPTTTAAAAPAACHACGLVTASITGRNSDTSAMILVDIPVGMIDTDDDRHSANGVTLYQPFGAPGTVVYATTSAVVPAGKHARAMITTSTTGGNAGTPAMIPVNTPVGRSNTDDDMFNAFAVELYRPSSSLTTTVSSATAVRTTFACSSTTTSVTGGDDDARTIATIGANTKGTHPHRAPTGRLRPPGSKARLQAKQGEKSAPVAEVSGTWYPIKSRSSRLRTRKYIGILLLYFDVLRYKRVGGRSL